MGGARGFSNGCILLRIGQLPVLSPEINACVYEVGAGYSPAPLYQVRRMGVAQVMEAQADAAALVDDALRAVLNKRQSKG